MTGEGRHAFVEWHEVFMGGSTLPRGGNCKLCGLPPDAEVHREAEPEKALVELARLVGPDLLNVTSEDIAAIRDGSAMFASPPPQAQPEEAEDPECHYLKTWLDPFEAIWDGRKTFELRRDDRGFEVGDCLHLREWNEGAGIYTGRWVNVLVTYKVPGGLWGLPDHLCVLAFKETARYPSPPPAQPERLAVCNKCGFSGYTADPDGRHPGCNYAALGPAQPAETERSSSEVMQDDMTALMKVLGISTHARPCSPHEVMVSEIIPAVRALVAPPPAQPEGEPKRIGGSGDEDLRERAIQAAGSLIEWLENEEVGVALSDDALRKIRDAFIAFGERA